MPRSSLMFRLVVMVCLWGSGIPITSADDPQMLDQIWHQPPARSQTDSNFVPRPIEKVVGKVTEVNREVFRVQPVTGSEPVFIAHDRIVWLVPAWANPQALQGMQAFEAGKYSQAIESLLQGIKDGPPVWQQQWLLVHLAQAAFEVERFGPVLQLVSDFSSSRPPENFIGLLPIHWSSRNLPATALSEARTKVDSPDPLVRLVAASWLLGSSEDRTLAERTLDGLAAEKSSPLISEYAEVLRWRRTPVPEIPKLAEGWIKTVDRWPVMLQSGPLMTIADRLQAAGDRERSQELFLSVSLLHQQPKPLADRARRELQTANK